MQPPRKAISIRALATVAIAGIVTFTAACGGGGSASQMTGPYSSSSGGSTGAASTGGPGIGFYDGKFKPSGIESAVGWLGSGSIKYAEDFIDATDWSHIANPWQLSNWKGTKFEMVWGVPMLPCGSPSTQCATNVSDYDLVANGGADSQFKTLAQNLVSSGFSNSYIRLGWEMNSASMAWSICNQEGSGPTSWLKDFVPAFRNIVTSMRSVSGANFKFIWNPIDSSSSSCPGVKMEDLYPGDSYVDAVASDVYDGIATQMSDTTRWSDLLNGTGAGGYTAVTPNSVNGESFKGQGYGLKWLAAFGKEHNKEVSIPEWGLDETGTFAGGGDDAYFVTQMADWIKANDTGPAIFWNYAQGNLPLDIPNYTNGGTPKATAAFKAAFSSGS